MSVFAHFGRHWENNLWPDLRDQSLTQTRAEGVGMKGMLVRLACRTVKKGPISEKSDFYQSEWVISRSL